MTRIAWRPAVALGLILGAAVYLGCSREAGRPPVAGPHSLPAQPKPASGGDAAGSSSGAKLVADWPTPDGAILLSGLLVGYLEPCGCTQGQLGGLARRFDLIVRLKAQGWKLVALDLGDLIADPATARGGLVQTRIKYAVAVRALTLMGYNAMGLTVDDLKLGVTEMLGQLMNVDPRPKLLAANVTPQSGFSEIVVPSLVVDAGPIKVGVTSIVDPAAWKDLNDPDKNYLPAREPGEVLPDLLARLEKESDVQVLLVHGPIETARALAQTYPGFEIVVGALPFDPPDSTEVLNGGKTQLISIGKKGKYVGVVGLYKDKDSAAKIRYKRVTLNARYDDKGNAVARLIHEELQKELKDARVVEEFPRFVNAKGAAGATYLGSESCKSCHPNTFAKWASTKHAHAFEDIVNDPRGDHQFDAECVSCHTTGFGHVGGWVSSEQTPALKANGCENCHGPASKHAASPDDPGFRAKLKLTAELADKNRLCIHCHDEDNSPKFDFATFYGKVSHKGMDTYTDPKVHQGSTPSVARQAP